MNIYDIAQEAGVSISTVSRVLNNKSNVSPKTVQKVREVMKKNNYTPNSNARALVMNTTQTIGIITVGIKGAHYASVAHAAMEVFGERGYNCLINNAGHDVVDHEQNIRQLVQNSVDGLLFIGSIFESRSVERLVKTALTDLPIVMVNASIEAPNVYSVKCNEEEGMRMATEHLCRNGHQKIAFMKADHPKPSDVYKEKGYRDMLQQYGLEPLVYTTEDEMIAALPVTDRILDEHPDLTGIVYSTDTMAVGGLKAIINRGLRVPEDIEVIGHNNSDICSVLTPTLTSIDSQADQLGINAARILLDVMEGRKTTKKLVLTPEMVYRESTKRNHLQMQVIM